MIFLFNLILREDFEKKNNMVSQLILKENHLIGSTKNGLLLDIWSAVYHNLEF